jgi:hypothetical protein
MPAVIPTHQYPLDAICASCGHRWGRHNSYGRCCDSDCTCRMFGQEGAAVPPAPLPAPAPQRARARRCHNGAIVLTLTQAEAEVLRTLAFHTGGVSGTTRRRLVEYIDAALGELGIRVRYHDIDPRRNQLHFTE